MFKVLSSSSNLLFDLDKGLVLALAIKVKDLVPKQLLVLENVQVEVSPRPNLRNKDQRQIEGGEMMSVKI